MRKRFKISDFEESCNNEMLTQEDDAEDKDDNDNAHEANEEEMKNENGFRCSSRIQKRLQKSEIEDSCDDEPVVIQDIPEDRTDSNKVIKGVKNYHIMLVNYRNVGPCHQRTAQKDLN